MGPEKFQIGTIKLNFTSLSKTYKRNAGNKTTEHKIQFLKEKQQNNYLLLMQFNTGVIILEIIYTEYGFWHWHSH